MNEPFDAGGAGAVVQGEKRRELFATRQLPRAFAEPAAEAIEEPEEQAGADGKPPEEHRVEQLGRDEPHDGPRAAPFREPDRSVSDGFHPEPRRPPEPEYIDRRRK